MTRDRIEKRVWTGHASGLAFAAWVGALLVFGLLMASAGCAGRQDADDRSYTEAAEEAFALAERAIRRRDYPLARERLREVYQNFPYSRFAALSELRMADTFFLERSWARAVESYRRFVRFYPTHPEVDYASFRIAEAYYRQMPRDPFLMPPSHERSLGTAVDAHQALQTFVAEFPNSAFHDEAAVLLASVRERLARHEMYVAEFYMRRRNAAAVASRTEEVLRRFPETAVVPRALFLSARANLELGSVDVAVDRLETLATEWQETELGQRARGYLERHRP